jgi:hypothetical protein
MTSCKTLDKAPEGSRFSLEDISIEGKGVIVIEVPHEADFYEFAIWTGTNGQAKVQVKSG